MLAVDTNVIVRYLTHDDAEQFAKASALIRSEDVYVCTTPRVLVDRRVTVSTLLMRF
jgi:predicted nucleic-acid-binding protein